MSSALLEEVPLFSETAVFLCPDQSWCLLVNLLGE